MDPKPPIHTPHPDQQLAGLRLVCGDQNSTQFLYAVCFEPSPGRPLSGQLLGMTGGFLRSSASLGDTVAALGRLTLALDELIACASKRYHVPKHEFMQGVQAYVQTAGCKTWQQGGSSNEPDSGRRGAG